MPRTETPGSFVRFTLDVAGTMREYFVYLPKSYDSMRAYPVVYQFHGAGGTGKSNNVPIERSSGTDAIVVGGTALVNTSENRTQWQFTAATSPDLAFFDALVTTINANYCVDTSRLFATGFSSGSWMCNLLGCLRPKVLRAYGVVSGGIAINTKSCTMDGIAARFIHDQDDTENVIAGNQRARDRLLTTNGCGMTTAADEPSPCVRYQGCRAGLPVDWCQTSGQGHNVQASLSGPALWRFFSSF